MEIFKNIINSPKTTLTGIVGGVVMIIAAFGIDISEQTKQDIVTAGAIILPVIIGAIARDSGAPQA